MILREKKNPNLFIFSVLLNRTRSLEVGIGFGVGSDSSLAFIIVCHGVFNTEEELSFKVMLIILQLDQALMLVERIENFYSRRWYSGRSILKQL